MSMDETADTARSTASSVASTLADAGRTAFADVRGRATEAASRAGDAARAEAMGRAETAKETLATEGERLAQTLRGAADDGDTSIQARVMAVVADSVDDLTATLRNRSFSDLVGDAQSFARRNPGAFAAVAALAGFALVRFARASTPSPASSTGGYDPSLPATSQGYSTMPQGAGGYGSPRPMGEGYAGAAGYGSGEGASSSTLAAGPTLAAVSTSGMSTHGDDGDELAPTDFGIDPTDQADDDLDPMPSSSPTAYPDRSPT